MAEWIRVCVWISFYYQTTLGSTLTEVLVDCANTRPDDPVAFLADALEKWDDISLFFLTIPDYLLKESFGENKRLRRSTTTKQGIDRNIRGGRIGWDCREAEKKKNEGQRQRSGWTCWRQHRELARWERGKGEKVEAKILGKLLIQSEPLFGWSPCEGRNYKSAETKTLEDTSQERLLWDKDKFWPGGNRSTSKNFSVFNWIFVIVLKSKVTYLHPRKKGILLNQCLWLQGIKCSGSNSRNDKLFIVVVLFFVQLQPDQRATVAEPHQPAQVRVRFPNFQKQVGWRTWLHSYWIREAG